MLVNIVQQVIRTEKNIKLLNFIILLSSHNKDS